LFAPGTGPRTSGLQTPKHLSTPTSIKNGTSDIINEEEEEALFASFQPDALLSAPKTPTGQKQNSTPQSSSTKKSLSICFFSFLCHKL